MDPSNQNTNGTNTPSYGGGTGSGNSSKPSNGPWSDCGASIPK